MKITIRSASIDDAVRVQELRKTGWQDNYQYPEGNVTLAVLQNKLALLPPSEEDINYFSSKLSTAMSGTLVAQVDDAVVGVAFCEELGDSWCDIGIFVARDQRGKGIGSKLLNELKTRTHRNLRVDIFAKNPSRNLYKKAGFIEDGDEFIHHFDSDTYLPVQRLVYVRPDRIG